MPLFDYTFDAIRSCEYACCMLCKQNDLRAHQEISMQGYQCSNTKQAAHETCICISNSTFNVKNYHTYRITEKTKVVCGISSSSASSSNYKETSSINNHWGYGSSAYSCVTYDACMSSQLKKETRTRIKPQPLTIVCVTILTWKNKNRI